jgi:hypothetical protein
MHAACRAKALREGAMTYGMPAVPAIIILT